MSGVYKSLKIIDDDLAVTQALPAVSMNNPYPAAYIGPKYGDSCGVARNMYGKNQCYNKGTACHNAQGYLIENFPVPTYMPNPSEVPLNYMYTQNGSIQPCSSSRIYFRNEWEVMNTTNSKAYGGFDKYSIRDVPSCGDRDGTYMNIMDFAGNPFNRVMVHGDREPPVIYQGHSWGTTF